MSIFTSIPPVDAASARTLIENIAQQLRAAGIEQQMRRAPPEPTGCCGRGCNGCVWEGYFAAVQWWRDDALALLAERFTSAVPAPASPSRG